MTKPFLILFCLMFSLNLRAQKLNLETGKTFAFEYHLTTKGSYNSGSDFTYNFRVLGKDDRGNYRLECVLQKLKQRQPGFAGQADEFNTDSIRKSKLHSSSLLMPLSVLGKPFEVVLDSAGYVKEIKGIEELMNRSFATWQVKEDLRAQSIKNLQATPQVEIEHLFFPLSKKRITYPGSWTSEDKRTQYDVTGIKGALLMIKVSTSKEDSTHSVQKGDIVFNSSTGLKELVRSYSLNRQGGNTPSEMEVTESIRLVKPAAIRAADTAWINMAVKMSWMSTSLKDGDEYDSLKVFDAFKKYDGDFRNDAYYATTKLSLMQQFRSDRAYRIYSKEVAITPNHLIESDYSHLFNKIGDVLARSADSAYAVAQYMYKGPSFNDWVHNSFAQEFLRERHWKPSEEEKRGFAERVKKDGWSDEEIEQELADRLNQSENSYILLEKFNNSKNPALQKTAHLLYLWVMAKTNPQNKAALIRSATELKKLTPKALQEGNGGRYALLIYGMLLQSGEKKAAASLLDGTIKQLEPLVKDSLNAERYAQQNILAHAYYLKYKETLPADSTAALRYLSKASGFSPKNKEESAYVSFYDRVFLGSKESYRSDFLSELFKTGDRNRAALVITEHVNANPTQLGEMKKTYEEHFAGESFNRFFAGQIIPSWPVAPDFTLKGLDGKDHSLKDYSGKWLMIDFWGTWCSPCREEMPSLNSFAREISDGKYAKISFLSVACRNEEADVKTFFSKHNYSMPAVISDNMIERNYKVRGYPSKVIISPEGRMITLNYGTDWKDVLEQFSKAVD